jgi:hypothetical protein
MGCRFRADASSRKWLIVERKHKIMAYSKEIDEPIAAHRLWKQRLHSAVTKGATVFRLAQVQMDHVCDFGQWFYGLPAAVQETEQGQTIRELHAAFHTEAARILLLALDEHVAEAEQALEPGHLYAQLSEHLISAMTQWKATMGG